MPTDEPSAQGLSRRDGLLLFGGLGLGLAAIAAATSVLWPSGPKPAPISVIGGPFRLHASKGGMLDSASLAGRPFLMFFGFTHCPNVCPTTLADLGNLLDEFEKQGGDMRAYYVTLDPERDTPEAMRDYMSSFSERLTGLTGPRDEIERLARDYRVYVKRIPLEGGDYTLEHTMMVYQMDRNGGFVGPLDLDAGHALALRQLRALQGEAPTGRS